MKETGKVKILGLSEKQSGSKYHRIELPLISLNNSELDIDGVKFIIETTIHQFERGNISLTEDIVKDYDVVYYNWFSGTTPQDLDIWRQKYGFLLIADYDDGIPDVNHPTLGKEEIRNYVKIHLSKQAMIADALVVSNLEIAKDFAVFNPFILVSHNFLPIGQGQFTTEKTPSEKIRIGIIGSYSHWPDYETLRNIVKRICSDVEIQKKCKFVIVGDRNDLMSKKVINLFSANKNMEVEVIPFKEANEYFELFSNMDVILAPLVDNNFNRKKSALRLMEASIKNIPVIGSDLYAEKELSGLLVTNKPSDYYKWIKFLLKDDNLEKYSKSLSEANIKDSNFAKRINDLKEGIGYLLSTEYQSLKDNLPKNIHLWGITYEDGQFTEYEQYNNSGIKTVEQGSYLMEYNPVVDIIDNKLTDISDEDYIGIFSWKFAQKTGISKRLLGKLIAEHNNLPEKFDIFGFCPYNRFKYLEFSEMIHGGGFLERLEKVCNHLGLKMTEPSKIVYSNMFIAKKRVYTEFVNSVIKPAIEFMKNDPYYMENANYMAGLSSEKLKELTGMEFYPYLPFILERLLSIWMENNPQIKFSQIK